MNNESLYTVDEIAKKLDVSPRTVRRYINADAIKAVRIGGQWKVKKEDLTAYLNGDRGPFKEVSHDHIKEDDLCVFMDSEYYRSDSRIQICSIIDINLKDKQEATPIANEIMELLNSDDACCGNNAKFQYIYKDKEQIARFVVWGTPSSIEQIMQLVKRHE
ncbi:MULTISPECIES: helix-turn-helix domain-containing protein [unclassified Fusibacter]|uniref:helix-turn-helix domain-containing protein n=1 Tax=unclassified Fusibacter TaxID=2624464 RepID=UPI001011F498|nr:MULTISPECIES: helix-turn-helix domain-containing protein [unclassified Fusibacter]MCK8059278.1 helix-turn-helix domain-containing protein [Fusibacter sp. A2]NPE21258.1 helix-turn-helix domain-containing protein [Fusibacter sp. A1]RXV62523.1 DNA-binding protein [Fusibacter sp. A1]